jgi:acetyl esterase
MTLMLDDDQAALIAAAARAGMPQVREDLAAARARVAAAADRHGAEVAVVEDHVLDGPHGSLLVRQYAATPEPEQPALVYFHGGGMVLGSVEYSDTLCRQLCAESGVSIFSVDYRLAPEHKYPVATNDRAAICWVGERPVEKERRSS